MILRSCVCCDSCRVGRIMLRSLNFETNMNMSGKKETRFNMYIAIVCFTCIESMKELEILVQERETKGQNVKY